MLSQRAFAIRLIVGSLAFHERVHVQYKADPAITQNSRASQQVLLSEGFTQTFNYDLLLAEQFIHQETTSGIAGFDYDDDSIGRVDRPARRSQVLSQP